MSYKYFTWVLQTGIYIFVGKGKGKVIMQSEFTIWVSDSSKNNMKWF